MTTDEQSPGATEAPAEGAEPAADHFREILRMCEEELDRTGEPGRAARLLHSIGRLLEERLGDGRRAAERYREAYRIMPGYLPNLRAARRLMADRADWNMVLELLDAELHVTSAADQKAELYVERGRILEERLGAPDRARLAFARALELDERNPDAWRLLARSLVDAEAWAELDDLYVRATAQVSDPAVRASLLVLRARLQEERFGDAGAAAQLYIEATDGDVLPPAAVAALKRLHAKFGRWGDLVAVLEREAALLDDSSRALCHYRIARVCADRLGRIDKAIDHLERVERLVPDSVLALAELAHLYDQTGRYYELARVCLRQLELSADPGERLALHHKIGIVCEEHLDDDLRAMEHYRRAVEIRPGYVPALQALGKLCRKHAAWEQLLEMHRIEAELAPEPSRRALAHYRAGEVLETQLDSPEKALEQYQKAQRLVPSFLPALRALDRLYSRLGRWRDLIALYESEGEAFRGRRAVEPSSEDSLRLARIEQIGSLYESKLGDLDQAAESFRRILEIDPTHVGAVTALERIYEKAERWSELMEILEREAELVEDEAWVAALLHKVGEIAEERLGDRDLALLHYRRVLAISPSYVPALTSLGRMYYQQGRWGDLLGMYRKEAEVAARREDRVPILFKMGELYLEKEAKEEEAEECFRQCLELDPTFPPAHRALERIYRRRRDWERLAEILEAQAAELRDPLAKAVAFHRVGELWEERLGREALASDAYASALAASGSFEPAREALARLSAAKGSWEELASIYEEQLVGARRGFRRAELLTQLAALREDRLDDLDGAVSAYEEALALVPTDVGALLALIELYRRLGRWERLAEACRRLADRTGDYFIKAGALRELGLTLQERLASGVGAAEAWEGLLEFRPTDGLALTALERSARARGDLGALVRILTLQIERSGDSRVGAALRFALAATLDAAGDRAASLGELRKILLIEPDHFAALEGTRRLAADLGDRDAEIHATRQLAEVAGEPLDKASSYLKAAAAMEADEAPPQEVAATVERALDLDPDSEEAADLLERALTRAGDPSRLRDQLARAAGRAKVPARIVALNLRVASISADALEDHAAALASVEKAFKVGGETPELLDLLAGLYLAVGRWEESMATGERLLAASREEAPLSALLRQARLLDDKAGVLERAADLLAIVLERDPGSVEALRRIGSIRARQKEWTEALVVFERLAALETEPARRADALLCLAEVHVDGTADLDVAVGCLARALEAGAEPASVLGLLEEAFDRRTEPGALADAYRRLIGGSGDAVAARSVADLEVRLAALLVEDLGERTEAIARYRSALARCPDHGEARSRLAGVLGADDATLEDAVREHRVLRGRDPFRFASARALHDLWVRAGQKDRAAAALSLLVCFKAATEDEARAAAARPGGEAPEARRAIGRSALRTRLYPSPPPAHAVALLEALEPALPKAFPANLAAHGLGPADALGRSGGAALRRRAERVARLLGIDAFEVYVSQRAGTEPSLEPTAPPSLILPPEASALPERQQTVVLGEALAPIALGTWPLRLSPLDELEALLAGATRLFVDGFGRGELPEASVEEHRKRLERAVPRKHRKVLAEAARAYADKPRADLAGWAEAAAVAARRAGLLATGDLAAALEVARSRDPAIADLPAVTTEEMVALFSQSQAARDLVGWFLSDEHFVLRRMAGLDAG